MNILLQLRAWSVRAGGFARLKGGLWRRHTSPWHLSLALSMGLIGCAPALDWRTVSLPQSEGLTMVWPCKPERQTRQVAMPGLNDSKTTMHTWACEADGVLWAVGVWDAQTPGRRLQALGAWQAATLANLAVAGPSSAQWQDVSPFHAPGSTPHPDAVTAWARGYRPVGQQGAEPVAVKAWYFSKGLHVFQASVWAGTLQANDPRWQTFAQGIHFQQ